MATLDVRERAHGTTYRVRWTQGGRRLSETFTDRAAADIFRADVEKHHGTPPGWTLGVGYGDDDTVTVAAAVDSFLESRLTTASGHTLARYRRAVDRHIIPTWGDRPVAAISYADVQELINARHRDGAAAKTLRNLHGIIHGLMQHACRRGWRADNPCTLTVLPRAPRGHTVDYFTPEQFSAILAAAHVDIQPLLLVAVGTGARWGELTALTPASVVVDHAGTRLRITQAWKQEPDNRGVMRWVLGSPKTTRSQREIFVAGRVADLLVQLADRGGDWLFTAPRGGPWRYPNFHVARWTPAVTAARATVALPDPCTFHFLRHTYAWWSLSAGADLPSLQDQMGHESIQMTKDRYGGLNPLARAASARFSAAAVDALELPSHEVDAGPAHQPRQGQPRSIPG